MDQKAKARADRLYAIFEEKAQTAISTPAWCNNFFVQPYSNGSVSMAFGSTLEFISPRTGEFGQTANIVSAILVDRSMAINFCAFVEHLLEISEEEIAKAKATHFPPAKEKTP